MAAGVLSYAHRIGLDVPHDLSVAGFDDTPLAQLVWPPLTTVRQPVRELAYAATDQLFCPDPAIVHQRLQHELMVRGSTAPLRKS
jgi:LacI family transcriptional regulator